MGILRGLYWQGIWLFEAADLKSYLHGKKDNIISFWRLSVQPGAKKAVLAAPC